MSLQEIRERIKKENIDVYILPRTDEHQSEYLCVEDERLAFLTGFTGSFGLALVSQSDAFVWTDSRYFLQAEKELKEGWSLKKLIPEVPRWTVLVSKTYPKGTVVGIDGRLVSASTGEAYKKALEDNGIVFKVFDSSLIDEYWTERPKSAACDIFVHESWAGIPAKEKIQFVQKNIEEKKGNGALFADLSTVCWLLNVRSNEIPYNPFMKGILFISPAGDNAHTLYLPAHHPHHTQHSEQLKAHLASLNVVVKSYPWAEFPEKTLVEKGEINYLLYSSLKDPISWSGIGLYRAKRNQKEIDGFRNAHIRDGVAQVRFWSWRSKQDKVGEFAAAQKIDNFRIEEENCKGLSFTTISSGGPNGAIVHYHPHEQNDFITDNNMVLLVDSGGQYLDGTTDVTRCFHFGEPTAEEKDSYTRVLLGNLDIERLVWPKSTKLNGNQIDVLARRRLWQAGKDYGHGTGHGVGFFQGVHESPVGISFRNETVFEPGMIVSNEPGYYEDGKYGIRIENLIMCLENEKGLYFEPFTLCPYDLNLIERSLLTAGDVEHINKYHERILTTLGPRLEKYPEALEWLKHATRAL